MLNQAEDKIEYIYDSKDREFKIWFQETGYGPNPGTVCPYSDVKIEILGVEVELRSKRQTKSICFHGKDAEKKARELGFEF